MRILFALLVSVCVASSSCGHVQPVINAIEDCASPVVDKAKDNLFPTVLAILECDGGNPVALPVCVLAGLGGLAASLGPSGQTAVDCIVDAIRHRRGASMDGGTDMVQERANAYLAHRGALGAQLTASP